jgi:hypothetical protein
MAAAAAVVAAKIGAAIAAKLTAAAVVKAAINVAIMYGLNKVVANQNKPRQQGGMITLAINPDEPRRLQVGKRMNAGLLVDWYVKGSKNNQLFMVIYLGEGPMGQVTRVFAGGRPVHTTALVHGTRTNIPGFRSTEGGAAGNRLWLTYYDGRPGQTADSTLVGASVGWSSNHVGTGCAYIIVECLWDSDNLRTPPTLSFEMEGAKLYDRRLDTTAGGSGSHRLDDPSTWALSDNPAVALDHYLLGRMAGSVKQFGVGLDADDVPYARFAALANLCDEDVDLKAGGTQKRYRSNGFLFADRTYADTIRDLCRAMNARPADFGGRIGVIDSEERTPVLTLTDGDVIEAVAEQYSPKRSWGEMVSVVRGTFQDPAQNYQAAEYPRVTDTDWVTADGGTAKEATLDLEMETSAERAQRLAYLYAVRERRQAQLTGTYGLRAIELEQGDWFIRSGGIFGSSPGKVFEVIDRALDVASMTVTLTAFEVDPADSAWDENIAADPLPAPIGSEDLLQAMEVPSLTVTGVTLSGTAAELPAIKVEWSAPDDPRALQIVVEAVPEAGGVPTSAVVDVATGEVVFTSGITDDTDYLVRARFVGNFTPSAWTSNFEVTTLGDYSVGVASSVPWSGVTGTGRPADNADVTGDNVAAGIEDQGWGATAAEAAASNALVPAGTNLLYQPMFHAVTGYWNKSGAASSGATLEAKEAQGIRYLESVAAGTPAANSVLNLFPEFAATRLVPATAGQRVSISVLVGRSNMSEIELGVQFYTSALGFVSQAVLDTNSSPTLGGGAGIESYHLLGGNIDVPATTAFVFPYARGYTNGSPGPRLRIARPVVALTGAGQTALTPWGLGFLGQPGADVTNDNTAAGIDDQGVFATGNYYEQTSDPGSAPNGSFLFRTDTNELKIRRSGSWGLVAKIAVSNLDYTLTNGFVKVRIGAGANTTDSVSFTGSGGSGSGYTFAHELIVTYTTGPTPGLSGSSGSPISVAASGVVGDEVRFLVQTTITDSAGNKFTKSRGGALLWET